MRSQTKQTFIFNDSAAAAVLIRHPKETHPNDNSEAIKRATGSSCHLEGDLEDIASALQDGTLQDALDRSVKDKKGTSAWIIEPTHITRSETNMSGAGPVDGNPEYLNSTRAERSGFLGPIFAVYQIAKKFELRQGKITMHMDNISSFQQGDPPKPREGAQGHHCGDYNLKKIKQLYTDELKERNITIEFQHVKAHQDEKKNRPKNKDGTIPPLTQAALLNKDCDARAEKCYDETTQSNKRIIPHTSIKVYFESNGVINTGKLFAQILRDQYGPTLKEYIKKKLKFSEEQFESVDWPSAQAIFKQNTFNQQVRITKSITHWLPIIGEIEQDNPQKIPFTPMQYMQKTRRNTRPHISMRPPRIQVASDYRIEKDEKKQTKIRNKHFPHSHPDERNARIDA